MSAGTFSHLVVEAGPDKGRGFVIPPEGARVGRSAGNDILLSDASLSRFHCRFFFKSDGQLWAADLGSTNQTVVNASPIQETRLAVDDRIMIGESTLRVVWDRLEPPPDTGTPPTGEAIDLGLKPPESPRRPVPWKAVALLGVLVVLAALVVKQWMIHPLPAPRPAAAAVGSLDLRYEKVQANASNIFRYALTLERGTLSIRVDDLASGRHVGKEKQVAPGMLQDLTRDLEQSGFYDLQPEYAGLAPDLYERWDCTLTLGRRAQRVVVLNRVEPEAFRRAREAIEEFGQNELGLAALALAPEQLRTRANDAFLQGQKLFDEREVRYENLYRAVKAFEEAEWYMETLEPKPDIYAKVVAARAECERRLQEQYDDHFFRAERAIKLSDWPTAARELRILSDMIPDRSDERFEKVQKKLLDVERRLGK